jgi:hypothetical protein
MFDKKDVSAAQTLVSLRTECEIYTIEGSEKDTLVRIVMFNLLRKHFHEYFSTPQFADRSNVLQNKIPQFAAKCEFVFYKSSNGNMAIYKDVTTIHNRIVQWRDRHSLVAGNF